jgi:hypothetical protein
MRDYRALAKSGDHFDYMLQSFRVAETEAELTKVMMLFVFDTKYDRGDVLLAEKAIKAEKGWT